MTDPQLDWRPVVAALADDRVRAAYARIVLGESPDAALAGVTASARAKVVDTLSRSGLVVIAEDGSAQATGAAFRSSTRDLSNARGRGRRMPAHPEPAGDHGEEPSVRRRGARGRCAEWPDRMKARGG